MAVIRKEWGDMMESLKIKGIKIFEYKRYKDAADNIFRFIKDVNIINKCGEYSSKLNHIPIVIKAREDNE